MEATAPCLPSLSGNRIWERVETWDVPPGSPAELCLLEDDSLVRLVLEEEGLWCGGCQERSGALCEAWLSAGWV